MRHQDHVESMGQKKKTGGPKQHSDNIMLGPLTHDSMVALRVGHLLSQLLRHLAELSRDASLLFKLMLLRGTTR